MIRLMTEADIHEVLPVIREQERVTIERLKLDPEVLLRRQLGPYSFAGVAEDKVAVLFGVAFPTIAALPRLWMLTTPAIERHKIKFLRLNQVFVNWASNEFGTIEGCVDCNNVVSRRWLEWLGFELVNSDGQYMRMQYGN